MVHHLGMVALLTGVYFCLNVASYGLSMFMPAIIKSQLGALGFKVRMLQHIDERLENVVEISFQA